MLIQKQDLRRHHRCHQKGKRLPLSTRKQSHRLLHPVLQPHIQKFKLLSELLLLLAADMTEICVRRRGCAQIRQRHIFFDRHVRRRALERILKKMTDLLAADMLLAVGDVLSRQKDLSLIDIERTGDRIKKGTLPGPVASDNGCKIALCQLQADILQRFLFIDGSRVEGLGNITDT